MVEKKTRYSAPPNEPRYGTPDDDMPELTDEMVARMRPLAELIPELAEEIRRTGRPRIENPKVQISIRLDRQVLDGYRALGPGWQSRVNEVLAKGLKRAPKKRARPAKPAKPRKRAA